MDENQISFSDSNEMNGSKKSGLNEINSTDNISENRSEEKDEILVNDQPLMKSSDGNSENNFDDSENSVNHKPVIKRQKSREHHSSSGSSNKSHISSRTSSKNHSRSASPHFSSTSGGVPVSKVITASSRSSSSSAGLVHKPSTCSNLSSAQDPLEYEFNAPIDAISGVESLNEPTFIYGLSHSSSVISGSPLLDALHQNDHFNKSWSSSGETGVARAKKTSWYNAVYPSYKSRTEDFKKIFTSLPSNERLIAEYSCAIQKDILVHGRLYATVNYLCFYANIFRWETSVALRWKDVNGLTKEKTALVIPNAIQVTTDTDKHFFTSFAARDKSYMMLFKLWQNALLDQPASSADIWRWVHSVYGDELGLTSDDEHDYVSPYVTPEGSKVASVSHSPPPTTKKPHLHTTMSVPANLTHEGYESKHDSSIVEEAGCSGHLSADELGDGHPATLGHAVSAPTGNLLSAPLNLNHRRRSGSVTEDGCKQSTRRRHHLASSDMSDNSEDSECDGGGLSIGQILGTEFAASSGDLQEISLTLEKWRSSVEGRELTSEVYPISVDQLFTLLFTNSKFFMDFHANRKTFDMQMRAPWTPRPENDSEKVREVSFTLSLTAPMGPKHSAVIETQVMHPDSQPGRQYIIDVEVQNNGIPYADSFYVTVHFYISRVSDNESQLHVIGAIKYRKTVWGIVKTFIEKNTWSGIEDFYSNLARALHVETTTQPRGGPANSKIRRKTKSQRKPNKSPKNTVSNGDGEEEEEDYEEEEIESFQGGAPTPNSRVLSNHQTSISHANNIGSPNQQNSSILSDSLIKIVLILLTGLLLANSVLFYKMWWLEANIGSPLSNLEEVLIATARGQSQDLNLGPGEALDQETWLKILQRQEAVHQLELQKWHDLLGNAATLLKQTEESLKNLQKSIHPLAIKKLRGLLDLKEELALATSERAFGQNGQNGQNGHKIKNEL